MILSQHFSMQSRIGAKEATSVFLSVLRKQNKTYYLIDVCFSPEHFQLNMFKCNP